MYCRYMYLLCWRRIREGCKYVVCCVLMATVWLLAAILTLFFTVHTKERFADEQAAGDLSSKTGVYRDHCRWGAEKLKEVVIAQLVVFGLGAVLGTGLSVALVIMSCFATGPGLLPIEEDGELAMDERGESDIEEEEEGVPEREKSPINRRTSHRGSLEEMSTDTLDRHEERERWRGQVGGGAKWAGEILSAFGLANGMLKRYRILRYVGGVSLTRHTQVLPWKLWASCHHSDS